MPRNRQTLFKGGIPSHIKKAMGNMRKEGPAFDVIKQACNSLKLDYESPGIIGETVVHFSIEKCKLAILFESTGTNNQRKAEILRDMGWSPTIVQSYEIVKLGHEAIKNQLSELLREKSKHASK